MANEIYSLDDFYMPEDDTPAVEKPAVAPVAPVAPQSAARPAIDESTPPPAAPAAESIDDWYDTGDGKLPSYATPQTKASKGDDSPFTAGLYEGGYQQNMESLFDTVEMAGVKAGNQKMIDWAEAARKSLGEGRAYKPTLNLTDIRSASDAYKWAMGTLGQGIGSSIPSLGGAAVGGVIGAAATPEAGGAGAVPGALIGAGAASYLQNTPTVYRDLVDNGVDRNTAVNAAMIAGVPIAALDTASEAIPVFRLLGKGAARQVQRALISRIVKEAGKQATLEGLTEATQQVIGDFTAKLVADKDLFTKENAAGWLNNFAGGALVGGVIGGAGGVKPDKVEPGPNTDPKTSSETVEGTDPPATGTGGQEKGAGGPGTGMGGDVSKPANSVEETTANPTGKKPRGKKQPLPGAANPIAEKVDETLAAGLASTNQQNDQTAPEEALEGGTFRVNANLFANNRPDEAVALQSAQSQAKPLNDTETVIASINQAVQQKASTNIPSPQVPTSVALPDTAGDLSAGPPALSAPSQAAEAQAVPSEDRMVTPFGAGPRGNEIGVGTPPTAATLVQEPAPATSELTDAGYQGIQPQAEMAQQVAEEPTGFEEPQVEATPQVEPEGFGFEADTNLPLAKPAKKVPAKTAKAKETAARRAAEKKAVKGETVTAVRGKRAETKPKAKTKPEPAPTPEPTPEPEERAPAPEPVPADIVESPQTREDRREALKKDRSELTARERVGDLSRDKSGRRSRFFSVRRTMISDVHAALARHFSVQERRYSLPQQRDINDGARMALLDHMADINNRKKFKNIGEVISKLRPAILETAKRHAEDIAADIDQQQAEQEAREAEGIVRSVEEAHAEDTKKRIHGGGQERERAGKNKGISPDALMTMSEKNFIELARKHEGEDWADAVLHAVAMREKNKGAGAARRASQTMWSTIVNAQRKNYAAELRKKAPRKPRATEAAKKREKAVTTHQKLLARTPEQVAADRLEYERTQAEIQRNAKLPAHKKALKAALKEHPIPKDRGMATDAFNRLLGSQLKALVDKLRPVTGNVKEVQASNTPAENYVAVFNKNFPRGMPKGDFLHAEDGSPLQGTMDNLGEVATARVILENDPNSLYEYLKSDPSEGSHQTDIEAIDFQKKATLHHDPFAQEKSDLAEYSDMGIKLSRLMAAIGGRPAGNSQRPGASVRQSGNGLGNMRTGAHVRVPKEDVVSVGSLTKHLGVSRARVWNWRSRNVSALAENENVPSMLKTLSDLMDRRMADRAKDIPVYMVSDADMATLTSSEMGGNDIAHAFFMEPTLGQRANGAKGAVVIRKSLVEQAKNGDKGDFSYVMRHEIAHALTVHAIANDIDGAGRIMSEIAKHFIKAHPDIANALGEEWQYGTVNLHEFVAEAFSNPAFQQILASTPLPEHLQKTYQAWTNGRPATVWDAFKQLVAKIIGTHKMGVPGQNMLEAIINLNEPGVGEVDRGQSTAKKMFERYGEQGSGQYRSVIQPTKDGMASNASRADMFTPVSFALMNNNISQISGGLAEKSIKALEDSRNFGTNISAGVQHGLDQFTTLEQLAQQISKIAGPMFQKMGIADPARRVVRAAQTQNVEGQRFAENGRRIEEDYAKLLRKHPDAMKKMVTLAHDATLANYDPSLDAADGRNKHFAKPTSKTAVDIHEWRRNAHATARAEFLKLPEAVQAHMRRIGEHFTEKFDQHIDQLMDNLIDGTNELNPIKLPKGMTLTDLRNWVRDDGLTREPGDPKKLTKEERRDRAISKALPTEFKRTLGTMQNARRITFFVPLARRGDHVVNATKTFETDPPGGGQTGRTPGEFYFVDRKSFMDFMKKHEGEPIAKQPSTRWMNYDAKTQTMVPSHEKEQDAKRIYFVTMQTRNFETFDTLARANTRHAELLADPSFTDVKAPILRKAIYQGFETLPDGVPRKIAERAVLYATKNMPKHAVEHWKEAFIHIMMQNTSMTRMQGKRLPRRNVLGFSEDLQRSIHDANTSMANHQAKLATKPEMTKALEALDTVAEAMRSDSSLTENEAHRVAALISSMRKNIKASEAYNPASSLSRAGQMVSTLGFLKALFSPAYTMLQLTQPWAAALPILSRTMSLGRAMKVLAKSYKAVGGGEIMWNGGVNSLRAFQRGFRDKLIADKSVLKPIKERFAKDEGLLAMLQELEDRGLIADNAGLELDPQQLGEFGLTVAERVTNRIALIARKLPEAAEVVNRATTAHAVYTTSIETMSHEKAVQAAVDAVTKSQGDMSTANSPEMFKKNNYLRLAMQFKKYPQMMTYNMVKAGYDVFKGETPEVQRMARRELLTLAGYHALMAGAVGMPFMEGVKFLFFLASMFGLGSGLDDFENDLQNWLSWGISKLTNKGVGKYTSEAIMRGAPRLIGVNLSGRVGLDTLIWGGKISNDTAESWWAQAGRTAAGAGGSQLFDVGQGLHNHDWAKMMPMKFMSDIIKGYQNMTEGLRDPASGKVWADPYGPYQALLQSLGFQPAVRAEEFEPGGGAYKRKQDKEAITERRSMTGPWVNAISPGERARAWDRIRKWNKGKPAKERITMGDLQKAKKRAVQEDRKSKLELQRAQ